MGWKEDARRTIVSDKKMLETFPGGWVKIRKFSVKGKDEINAELRKVQAGFDKGALIRFAQKAKKAKNGVDESNMMQELSSEELGMMLDGQTAEVYDLVAAKIRNGIESHNFCDGDIDTRNTDKDIKGFARDIMEYPEISNEIVSLIEEFNPFSGADVQDLKDVTEWVYCGTEFESGDRLPDERDPGALIDAVGPWVQDCIRLLDGDGTYQHYKYGVVYANEPAFDMDVLDIIRAQWNKLRNEEQERKWQEKSASR